MSDKLFFPLAGLAVAAMIAWALVWPQGIGARAPGGFGHETTAEAAARVAKSAPPGTTAPPAPVSPLKGVL